MKNRHINFFPDFTSGIQCLLFLSILYVLFNIIGEALVYKIVRIGPALGPGGILVLPLLFLVEDVIAEIYGYKVSRFLLWIILLMSILFAAICSFIVSLPSPTYWAYQQSYENVFYPILKVTPYATTAIFAGRFTNIYIITKFKVLTHGRFFWLRSIASTIFGTTVALSILFGFAFWGLVPLSGVVRLFVSDFLVRLSYSIIGGIPVTFLVIYLKAKLEIDVFDNGTNFNPFRLSNED